MGDIEGDSKGYGISSGGNGNFSKLPMMVDGWMVTLIFDPTK